MVDAKGLFEWAVQEGEAKVVDRVLIKVVPKLLSAGIRVSAEEISAMDSFFVSEEIFEAMREVVEQIVGKSFEGGK